MYCEKCGSEIDEAAVFCTNCGMKVHQEANLVQLHKESAISTARTFGILSIVGALTIAIAGLVCGIIGFFKVKDLKVPSHLEEQRKTVERLNIFGICLSFGLSIIALIIVTYVWKAISGLYYY